MRKLLLGSVVTAALVFTGCGGGSKTSTPTGGGTAADTARPVFTTGSEFTMEKNGTKMIVATDASTVTYTLTDNANALFSLTGNVLQAPEPDTDTDYNITIKATDSATNATTKTFLVHVKDIITTTIGGLEWTPLKVLDENGTISGKQTFAEAKTRCADLGMTLPTQEKLSEINTTVLKNDSVFNYTTARNSNQNTGSLVIWADGNSQKAFLLNFSDTNSASEKLDDNNYTDSGWTTDSTNFYTCVK